VDINLDMDLEERRVSAVASGPAVHTMTGAYALHALDEFEQRRFEKHLAACPECQVEVTEFSMAAAHLCLAVAEQSAPGIRARVLAEIADVRQLAPRAAVRWPWLVRMSMVVAAAGATAATPRRSRRTGS
jgi:anti-sigma factor RsiW